MPDAAPPGTPPPDGHPPAPVSVAEAVVFLEPDEMRAYRERGPSAIGGIAADTLIVDEEAFGPEAVAAMKAEIGRERATAGWRRQYEGEWPPYDQRTGLVDPRAMEDMRRLLAGTGLGPAVSIPDRPMMWASAGSAPAPADLERWFTFHAPVGDQAARYDALRAAGLAFAAAIADATPAGEDQAKAIQHARSAVHWAIASIACHPIPTAAGGGR